MTAADQTPAKRCGECRLGLGVHTPTDPYCDHHQTPATHTSAADVSNGGTDTQVTPATDSERDERLRSAREYAAALRGRNAVPGSPSEAMVALDDEVTRLTALLAERDATIERRSQWTSETERAVREALSTIGVDGTYGGERVVRGVLATVGGLITEQAATAECARCENDLPVAWTDDEDQGYCETCVNAIMTDLHTELAEQAATIERVGAVRDKHWETRNSLLANEINAALGSQRTEGQG